MAEQTREHARATYGSWSDCAGRFRRIYQQLAPGA